MACPTEPIYPKLDINALQVELVSLAALIPNPDNARTHTTKQIAKLTASIRALGFNVPIVIDEASMILKGHACYAAAQLLKMQHVPCVRLKHLSPAQKIAFAIADNKISDLSSFDLDALRIQIQKILDLDVNLNIEFIGFETAEIDILFDPTPLKSDPADRYPLPNLQTPAVTCSGDLWLLGRHRLLCADALHPESYERLLNGELATMAFTDPPWNVPVQGHVSGLGQARHAEFAMASGEMSEAEFQAFLAAVCALLVRFSAGGSIHFICMDWRHIGDLLMAGKSFYAELKNICVWNKTNAGMGSLYRSQHELIAVFKNGTGPHQNNVELGKHGRYRTNVWTYAGANAFSAARDENLSAHPTVKSLAMVADAIRDVSRRNDLMLDPFAGSGTTVLAAERTGRRAAAIEIEPRYVDVAIERWQRMTGQAAVLEADGRSFSEVRAQRQTRTDAAVACEAETDRVTP